MTINSEGTTQVQEVHGSIIDQASIAEKDVAEAEIDITESVISFSIPGVGADTEPVLYSAKHSISVEVGFINYFLSLEGIFCLSCFNSLNHLPFLAKIRIRGAHEL